MASTARAVQSGAFLIKASLPNREVLVPVQVSAQKVKAVDLENGKIVLQPRLCNLRSYGGESMKRRRDFGDVSPFFASLSDYIESSKNSQDFEIVSGRLAMVVFAATMAAEIATGNSIFKKMELEGIAEAGGACLGAVVFAVFFASLSSARNRVGMIFTLRCNAFIDSFIDQIVDGLFYENDDEKNWSDEV